MRLLRQGSKPLASSQSSSAGLCSLSSPFPMPWQETLHHKRETPQDHYYCDADDTNMGVIYETAKAGYPSARTGLPGLNSLLSFPTSQPRCAPAGLITGLVHIVLPWNYLNVLGFCRFVPGNSPGLGVGYCGCFAFSIQSSGPTPQISGQKMPFSPFLAFARPLLCTARES